jgi:hypothetical protein
MGNFDEIINRNHRRGLNHSIVSLMGPGYNS